LNMNILHFRHWAVAAAIFAVMCLDPALASAQEGPGGEPATAGPQTTPAWAYPLDPPGVKFTPMTQALPHPPAPDRDTPIHLPGSSVALTLKQVYEGDDWHPEDHPPMPEVVARGRKPDVMGCAFCHLQNGRGRPESSRLAGLPASYMIEQIMDFRNGVRKCAEPRLVPGTLMAPIAKALTNDEMNAAAQYFASLTFKSQVRVVESATAPKTRLAGGILIPVDPPVMEPLGMRIIEVPENLERTALHDSEGGFIAYVPVGSIKKGEDLATTGGARAVKGKIVPGRTIQCSICHGPGLKGLGNIPGIAGSNTSYTFRQLYDYQRGTRNGKGAELMKPVVANLSEEDMVSIVAYTASLAP
jgi:cytochrome c553